MTMTVLAIYNAAISAARGKGRLTSLSQPSREREECDTWYPVIRDQVQEAAYWPSSRATAQLTLVGETASSWVAGSPEPGFAYSYGLPEDYLRAWFLSDYSPFTISFEASLSRLVLNTDAVSPVLVYAARQDNPVFWSAGQQHATIHALAAAISGPLTGQNQLEQLNYQKANEFLQQARAHVLNSQQYRLETLPPELAARGGTGNLSLPPRYFYPLGSLFGVTNG